MIPERSSTSNDRIRELIDDLGMSQIEFCNRTGIKASALSNYLKGNRVPRQDAIMRIADTFNISASWLMGYDVPKVNEPHQIVATIYDKDEKATSLLIRTQADRLKIYAALLDAAEPYDNEQLMRFIETLQAFNTTKRHKKDTT